MIQEQEVGRRFGGRGNWLCQTRYAQSISGVQDLLFVLILASLAQLHTWHSTNIFSPIAWFLVNPPQSSPLGHLGPNTLYDTSLPLSPATCTPQRPFLYTGSSLQGIVEVKDSRLRLIIFSGIDPACSYWLYSPQALNAPWQQWHPIPTCQTPEETEQSSSAKKPPNLPPALSFP